MAGACNSSVIVELRRALLCTLAYTLGRKIFALMYATIAAPID